jgi:hypothetical protein
MTKWSNDMVRVRQGGPALVALGVLLTAAGCGGGPVLAPVEGTVRMNGRPLEGIQVEFWPVTKGARSVGVTKKDGKYQLTYNDKQVGAVVGPHRVLLHDLQVYGDVPLGRRKSKDADVTPVKASRIAAAYADSAKTPLKKEVSASPNVIDLDVIP